MVDWNKVKGMTMDVNAMERLVKGYSYADKQLSVVTDEKVCHLVVRGIREAKGTIFNMIELLYELEKKEPVSRHLQKLKDELDIFSDEVKARYCDWKGLNEKWMVNLVKHDIKLVSGLEKLNTNLQKLYEKVLSDKALLSGSMTAEKKLWQFMRKKIPDIEKQADSLVVLFKEREGICNLRPLSLEKTYEKIQERIDRQI